MLKGNNFVMEDSKKEKTQTTVRLPTKLKETLQKEADKKGISLNAYILLLIDIGRQYQHL